MALTIPRLTGPAPPQVRALFARVWAASLPGPAPDFGTPTAGEALYLAWQGTRLAGLPVAWYRFLYSASRSPYCRSTSRNAAPYRAALIRPTPETSNSASSSCGQRRAISSSVALEKIT